MSASVSVSMELCFFFFVVFAARTMSVKFLILLVTLLKLQNYEKAERKNFIVRERNLQTITMLCFQTIFSSRLLHLDVTCTARKYWTREVS
jgi:hypothetical protein